MDYLALSGGGINGILQLGALKYLELAQDDPLHFKGIVGTSIGALIGLLLTRGLCIDTLIHIFYENYKDICRLEFNVDIVHRQHALQDPAPLENIIKAHISPELTFRDLYAQTQTHFACLAVNLAACKLVQFDHINTPEVSVLRATMASMAIPFVFPLVTIAGHQYCDGGCMMNYPCTTFPVAQTLGLNLTNIPRPLQRELTLVDTAAQTIQAILLAQQEYIGALRSPTIIDIPCTCLAIPLNPEQFDVYDNVLRGGYYAQQHFNNERAFTLFCLYVISEANRRAT